MIWYTTRNEYIYRDNDGILSGKCLHSYGKKTYFPSSDPHHGIKSKYSDITVTQCVSMIQQVTHIFLSISRKQLYRRSFSHSFRHSYLAFYLTFLSDIIPDILSSILSDIFSSRWGPARPTMLQISPSEVRRGPQRSDSGEAHYRELALEVRRGPLRSRAGRWGPARPTAIESWQLRSGEAHCDRELAVEIRRGPLQSRTGR